jgi:lysozyme
MLALIAGCGRRAPDPVPEAVPARDTSVQGPLVTHPDFGDTDPHDWTWRAPRTYAIHGIDVSRWQGDIDWATARAAGVSFAYIKATEGGDVADPLFRAHWDGAGRAGVRRGAYHYFYFCRPAAEQARWFIRHVPRDATALPHVLDMEWTPYSRTCTIRPDGDKVRAEARVFLDMLEAHYGRRPLIYTTVDFFADTRIDRLGGTEFWLRSVAGHPQRKYPGAFWRIWQYTGTGIVPGVRGKVDINVFHDGPEAWARWAG